MILSQLVSGLPGHTGCCCWISEWIYNHITTRIFSQLSDCIDPQIDPHHCVFWQMWNTDKATNREMCPHVLFSGGDGTPELDGRSMSFATRPEMIPVLIDMHPAKAVCFFRAVRSSWLQALLLQTPKNLLLRSSKPGGNPCVACCGPCASISRPASAQTGGTVPWGYSHNKEQNRLFHKDAQAPWAGIGCWEPGRALRGTWSVQHHTALKNRLARGLASALRVLSLKTIRPLTFSRAAVGSALVKTKKMETKWLTTVINSRWCGGGHLHLS